jgi:hypothetical protein
MLTTWQRVVPFILAGLLVINLIEALTGSGRGQWLAVALLVLALALTLWHRPRPKP